MARITALRNLPGTEFMSSALFDGVQFLPIITRTPTRLTLEEDGSRVNFNGTGFAYQMMGQQVVGMSGGTGTSISFTNSSGSLTYLNWTGFNISAPAFFNAVVAQNWTTLDALLFGTGDSYSLTDGRDAVRGFGGDDTLQGFGGRDRLFGDEGADQVLGGGGDDKLTGGAGRDTLSGAAGDDVFVFTHAGAANRDTITDFNAADDALQFDNAAFAGLGRSGALNAANFVSGTAPRDASDRFIYDQASGSLWHDADGKGGAAKVLVAELADGTALSAADIFVI